MTLSCPRTGCSFQSKNGNDMICPNCENKTLAFMIDPKRFDCVRCEMQWSAVPCPQCGTGISANAARGFCYVATCVYGSYDCPEVWTLRRFRNNVLSMSLIGKICIGVYYGAGPIVVTLFGKTKWFNALLKPVIDKIVVNLQKSGVESSPYFDQFRE